MNSTPEKKKALNDLTAAAAANSKSLKLKKKSDYSMEVGQNIPKFQK